MHIKCGATFHFSLMPSRLVYRITYNVCKHLNIFKSRTCVDCFLFTVFGFLLFIKHLHKVGESVGRSKMRACELTIPVCGHGHPRFSYSLSLSAFASATTVFNDYSHSVWWSASSS